MVQITLLEVDLQDAEFDAPFAASWEGEAVRELKRALPGVARSGRGGSDEGAIGDEAGLEGSGSPGRGVALVGAFVALVVVGWAIRRARRRTQLGELAA